MEFLVHVTVTIDPADPRVPDLVDAEGARARELAATGHLRRVWRVPGAWANIGLWCAKDATELHELLTSLPLWPHARMSVDALADHPNDPSESSSR